MNTVIDILMDRDGISFEDATELVEMVRDEMLDDIMYAEEIFQNAFGLETDYIVEFLM